MKHEPIKLQPWELRILEILKSTTKAVAALAKGERKDTQAVEDLVGRAMADISAHRHINADRCDSGALDLADVNLWCDYLSVQESIERLGGGDLFRQE